MLEEYSIFKVLRTSKYYFYFSILQLVLTSSLLLTIALLPQLTYRHWLQVVIALLLLADLIIKRLTDSTFLKKVKNITDICILFFLSTLIIIEYLGHQYYEILEEIGSFVLILRYAIQLYRIISLVWQSRQVDLLVRLQEIRLDEIDLSEQIEVKASQRKQPKAL